MRFQTVLLRDPALAPRSGLVRIRNRIYFRSFDPGGVAQLHPLLPRAQGSCIFLPSPKGITQGLPPRQEVGGEMKTQQTRGLTRHNTGAERKGKEEKEGSGRKRKSEMGGFISSREEKGGECLVMTRRQGYW